MEMKQRYKQTEVRVIPDNWLIDSLENVCIAGGLVRGPFGGALKKESFVKDGFKVYEQKNAIYRDCEIGFYFIDDNKFNELKRFEICPGDFIVSCSGTIGRIYQIPENAKKGIINQALLKIKINKNVIHDKYFYYYFDWQRFQKKIIDNTQGGAMQNLVGMSVFRAINIPLPPLHEQKAIAEVLNDTDALITALDTLIAKKCDLKQGAMQQLLTGKKRLSGFSSEWKIKTLYELIECLDNLRVPLNESQRLKMQGVYPYCGANGILDAINQYLIDDDVILMAEDGGYYDEYLYRPIAYKMSGKFWVNNHAHILKAKDFVCQDFIYYSLVHKNILKYLASGTRAKLNKSELNKIEINLPTERAEQQAIAQILSDMDAEIEKLEHKRDKMKEIKQGMMQELLTGKTRLV